MKQMARSFTWTLCLALTVSQLHAEKPLRRVLINSARNRHAHPSLTGTLPDHEDVAWSITSQTLHGGKQEGVDLVTLDNGKLSIRIIPTRGMSILDVTHGALRLGWDSPVKEVVHPSFVNLESRGGLGWLEGFNEFMCRCGLEFAGHPGTDEFVDNTGATAEMDLTVHGKIGNIPASRVEIIADQDPPYTLRVRGVVYERMFYGPKLRLVTEISTVPGTDTFRIEDRITNQGAMNQEFQLIYHTNYGAPLLEGGASVHAPIRRIAPMNEHAGESIDNFATYQPPTLGFIEEVYLIDPLADEQGNSIVCLKNKAGDAAASISWSTKQLPYLTIWKNTAAAEDGYVTGLEPATGFPFNRKVEREFGRVPQLKPGQTRKFSLDYSIHIGQEAVDEVIGRIADRQAGMEPEIVRHSLEH